MGAEPRSRTIPVMPMEPAKETGLEVGREHWRRKVSRWEIQIAGWERRDKNRFKDGDSGGNWIRSTQVYQAVILFWLWDGLNGEMGSAVPEHPPQILQQNPVFTEEEEAESSVFSILLVQCGYSVVSYSSPNRAATAQFILGKCRYAPQGRACDRLPVCMIPP
ncbi:hypothetical protein DPX16_10898 [Anabarilius grahami]|uniref:Uncharacterized protein n=1 Tax=Anabarilius grahami TaxID=495550 RepID=A0A3N0Z7R0_ANAGA|nr:hypothetical protein DPX16_10898 [Anabarilius grahami]